MAAGRKEGRKGDQSLTCGTTIMNRRHRFYFLICSFAAAILAFFFVFFKLHADEASQLYLLCGFIAHIRCTK